MKMLVMAFILLAGCIFLSSCGKEHSCENCRNDNLPPIAKAGNDMAIALPKDSIQLDGLKSYDPDGTIDSFKWTKISGAASFTIVSRTASKTIVKSLEMGSYEFELQVTDDGGLSSKDTVIIIVDKVLKNHPPIAKAGADINITILENSVLLDGTASYDPDNNIISYAWTKIAGPSIVNISNPISSQTQAGNLVKGVYLFELIVTDAGALFSKDTVRVTVNDIPGKPPIADAGTDRTINYNLQTCSSDPIEHILDGSASRDPDGTIVLYQWSILPGAKSSVNIADPNAAKTTVSNLFPGIYAFRLEVTDNSGARDEDTITINVVAVNRPIVNAQLIPLGILSEKRKVSAIAVVNNKIFFAGGTTAPTGPGPHFSSRVDIFDINSGIWTTAELSQPRWGLTAVTLGSKVFFAGGTAIQSSPRVGQTSRVDVYDASTNSWSIMEMPRKGHFSSTASGNKVFFAGGNSIDIYDVGNNTWSAKNLSQSRYLISTANVQGKLYFSGGASTISGGTPYSQIDIYDPTSSSWSSSQLSKPKYGMISLGLRGKVMWAGGTNSDGKITNEVESIELRTGAINFSCLFQPNSFSFYSQGKSNNSFAFFVWDGLEKNKFDIYDGLNDTWSIGVLNQAIVPSMIISVNNVIYVVGSEENSDGYFSQVWKLVF